MNLLSFRPCYSKYNLLDVVKVGDIVFEKNLGEGFHHIAIVESIQYDTNQDLRWIRIIEAQTTGVMYSVLDDTRYDLFDDTLLRVNNEFDDDKLVYFLRKQIGKEYSIKVYSDSIDNEKWYCSSLVYGTFKYAGLDMKINGFLGITPNEIFNSKYTDIVEIGNHICVDFDYLEVFEFGHRLRCKICMKTHIEEHKFKRFKDHEYCGCGFCKYDDGYSRLGVGLYD